MSDISRFLAAIKTATFGEEVRGAIHDSIEQCYDDVSSAKTLADDTIANMEQTIADAEDQIDQTKDSTLYSITSTKNQAVSDINSAKDQAVTAANNAKESVTNTANTATSTVNQTKEDAVSAINAAVETIDQTKTSAVNTINQKVTDATQDIDDATEAATSAAQHAETAAGVVDDHLDDIVVSQTTQPSSAYNKVWLKPGGTDIVLAEMSDVEELESTITHLSEETENIKDLTLSENDTEIVAASTKASSYYRFVNNAWQELTNNSNFHEMVFSVEPDTVYKIVDGSIYKPYVPSVLYLDSSNNILGSTEIPTETTYQGIRVPELFIKTPENCTQILTNNFGSVWESSVFGISYSNIYEEEIEATTSMRRSPTEEAYIATETGAISLLNGSYVLRNIGAFEGWTVKKYDVKPGEKYHARGMYYPNTPIGAFMNGSTVVDIIGDNMQSYTTWAVKLNEYDVVVPNGVTQIWLNRYTTSETTNSALFKYVISDKSIYENKKWVCIGDSLTQYNSTSLKKYHDFIQEKTGINIVNLGEGGTGYKNAGTINNTFYNRISLIPESFDVITIFGSGNDMSYTLGDITDTTTDTICGCVNKTIDDLYAAFPLAKLGIISPCPWVSYPTNTNNAMAQYSKALKDICEARGIPFLDLYRCSGLRPWESEYRELVYSLSNNDGVHPNDIGQEILASHIEQFIKTILLA